MKLNACKCPECGGAINIDSMADKVVCEWCETPLFVERKRNDSNVIINITVYVQGNAPGSDFVICAGTLEKYNGAPTDVVIPKKVSIIGRGAFAGRAGLTSVSIPNTVRTIEEHAFVNCTGLANIQIPDSVRVIHLNAFSGCAGLTNITIPKSVERLYGGGNGVSTRPALQNVYIYENTQIYAVGEPMFSMPSTHQIRHLSIQQFHALLTLVDNSTRINGIDVHKHYQEKLARQAAEEAEAAWKRARSAWHKRNRTVGILLTVSLLIIFCIVLLLTDALKNLVHPALGAYFSYLLNVAACSLVIGIFAACSRFRSAGFLTVAISVTAGIVNIGASYTGGEGMWGWVATVIVFVIAGTPGLISMLAKRKPKPPYPRKDTFQ